MKHEWVNETLKTPVKLKNENWSIDYFEVLEIRINPKTGYCHAAGFARKDDELWGTGTIIQPTDPWQKYEAEIKNPHPEPLYPLSTEELNALIEAAQKEQEPYLL